MSVSKKPVGKTEKKAVNKNITRQPVGPKVFDVARPGKTPAISTSKPVIVTNRPVMQDPMVVNSNNDQPAKVLDSDQPPTAPLLKPVKKLVIKPPHEQLTPQSPAAAVVVLPAEPKPETSILSQPIAIQSTQSPVASLDQRKPLPAVDLPVSDEVAGPGRSDAQVTPGAEATAALAVQKRATAVRKLIADERYFLPINGVENKRNKRIAIAGLLLIVVLAVAWYDTALDAGLVTNVFKLPHSHFFTK